MTKLEVISERLKIYKTHDIDTKNIMDLKQIVIISSH